MIPFSRPSEWRSVEESCHEVGHTWSSSCLYSNLQVSCIVFYEGLKLYIPFYLVSRVLQCKSPIELLKVLPHAMRSAAFLAANFGGPFFFFCLFRRLIGRFYLYSSVLVPSSLGGACALLIERRSRRPTLAGYSATVAIELLFSMLKHRKILSPLPYGEVLLFSLATAVLFHRFKTRAGAGDMVESVLRTLLSPKLPVIISSSLQSTLLDNRITHILLVGVWAFLLGYFLQVLLSLLGKGTHLFKKNERMKTIKCILKDPLSIKFAAFLSILAAGYKVVNSMLYYLPLPRDLRLLLAGMAAGLSLFFYQSSSISLYVAWKALEIVYSMGVSRGWLKYIPHGEVLIYGLSIGLLFHATFMESHNLPLEYWNFLRRRTRGKILEFNFDKLDKFGTGASIRIKQWRNKQKEKSHH